MKIKTITANAIVAALYVAMGLLVAPIAFGAIQFRLPEIFNHLIVFNKKYFWGIIVGVFVTNLFFSSLGWYDLVFGVGQSILSLLITIGLSKFVKSTIWRMVLNTIVFTVTMAIIAFELVLVFELPFFYTWLTCAIGELVIMGIGIPLMYWIDQKVHFNKLIEK
ncbi:QueT transporter family protein [Listeria costaricensis]|uniref:QueT transporter family protein n=1 Tax=Listeria costaricensis TaxID=2026604 RepID=UPI000C06F61F|nr:QueT transporter family protein [Listeria costaricensis]